MHKGTYIELATSQRVGDVVADWNVHVMNPDRHIYGYNRKDCLRTALEQANYIQQKIHILHLIWYLYLMRTGLLRLYSLVSMTSLYNRF
ncbi:hypothetical protein F4819DRAFT_442578 [Hypoxylon fuscum]|nr:hypothetical protein F4819DRAFT_442578 [Hypoxylon fuscum]